MPRRKESTDPSPDPTIRAHARKATNLTPVALTRGETAAAVVELLEPGGQVIGFSKGQFSISDLLVAILAKTGPAALTISTWTAHGADIAHARRLLDQRRITSARWLLDLSFPSREPSFFQELRDAFGDEAITLTRTHAKFSLIHNAKWSVVVRTSMNLNYNPRFEDFDVADDPALYRFCSAIVDELVGSTPTGAGFDGDTRTPLRTFAEFRNQAEILDTTFGDGADLLGAPLGEITKRLKTL